MKFDLLGLIRDACLKCKIEIDILNPCSLLRMINGIISVVDHLNSSAMLPSL